MDPKKPIQKKILHAGVGASDFELPDGTKLKFHFVTKKTDGTILDDSRKWDKPMELLIGKKFKLEAWEMCLKTMRVQEVSSFVVKRQFACDYPTVAKTLRDTFGHMGKKKDPDKIQRGHMCGMMAMQMEGGLGYEDLNQLMKDPQDLEFIIELLSVELPDEYKKEGWQMDAEEKLNSVPNLKDEGNRLYGEKKYIEATAKYADAIGRLEQLMLREKPHDEEWLALREQKIPLLLNFSQCKLLASEFYPVIEHCTEVLEIDPDNVKALYRRAKAHVGAWNPEEAKSDFGRVAELDSSLEVTCKKELKRVEDMEKVKDKDDQEKLRNLF